MSDGELTASGGTRSHSVDDLLENFDNILPRDEYSGNFKLLNTVGLRFDDVGYDIDEVENATHVQWAETRDQVERLAKLVELPPKDGESKEKYRTRTIAEFQTMTSEGTAWDVINNTGTLLDIDNGKVSYEKLTENGAVKLTVPGDSLENSSITNSEFRDIINKHSAAGFRIDAATRGTFTYLSESDYSGPYDSANGGFDSSSLSSDPSKGYDGLDSNGDPKNNGGTYAGLI
jgi:hypothetical protein